MKRAFFIVLLCAVVVSVLAVEMRIFQEVFRPGQPFAWAVTAAVLGGFIGLLTAMLCADLLWLIRSSPLDPPDGPSA